MDEIKVINDKAFKLPDPDKREEEIYNCDHHYDHSENDTRGGGYTASW